MDIPMSDRLPEEDETEVGEMPSGLDEDHESDDDAGVDDDDPELDTEI